MCMSIVDLNRSFFIVKEIEKPEFLTETSK